MFLSDPGDVEYVKSSRFLGSRKEVPNFFCHAILAATSKKEGFIMRCIFLGLIALLLLPCSGCASKRTGIGNADPASYGLAKKKLAVGKTTQQDVIQTFGAPNITTKGTGDVAEVWTYEKVSSDYAASQWDLGLGGGGGGGGGSGHGGGGGGGALFGGYGKQKGSTSVRTVTLIIKFDANEIVSDYKIMETNF